MKLDMTFPGPVAPEEADRNRLHVSTLGLAKPQKQKRPPLAVVGGGPSLASHVDELRAWQGDIWIACGAFPWCLEQGIEGTFFNVDPQPAAAEYARGAKRALVSADNDPAVFETLSSAEVEVFDLPEGTVATTVTAAPILALSIGHPSVSFFGCDSSYVGQTHAYADIPYPSWLAVRCGGETYETSLPLLAQAEVLSEGMRLAPDHLICRSGGLLAALVADPEYDVVACTRGFYMGLTVDGQPLHEKCPPIPWKESA